MHRCCLYAASDANTFCTALRDLIIKDVDDDSPRQQLCKAVTILCNAVLHNRSHPFPAPTTIADGLLILLQSVCDSTSRKSACENFRRCEVRNALLAVAHEAGSGPNNKALAGLLCHAVAKITKCDEAIPIYATAEVRDALVLMGRRCSEMHWCQAVANIAATSPIYQELFGTVAVRDGLLSSVFKVSSTVDAIKLCSAITNITSASDMARKGLFDENAIEVLMTLDKFVANSPEALICLLQAMRNLARIEACRLKMATVSILRKLIELTLSVGCNNLEVIEALSHLLVYTMTQSQQSAIVGGDYANYKCECVWTSTSVSAPFGATFVRADNDAVHVISTCAYTYEGHVDVKTQSCFHGTGRLQGHDEDGHPIDLSGTWIRGGLACVMLRTLLEGGYYYTGEYLQYLTGPTTSITASLCSGGGGLRCGEIKLCGLGILEDPDGSVYWGSLYMDQPDGFGARIDPSRGVWEVGHWRCGRLEQPQTDVPNGGLPLHAMLTSLFTSLKVVLSAAVHPGGHLSSVTPVVRRCPTTATPSTATIAAHAIGDETTEQQLHSNIKTVTFRDLTYTGEIDSIGHFHGHGTLTFLNGSGEWMGDWVHGQFKCTESIVLSDGSRYCGEFLRSIPPASESDDNKDDVYLRSEGGEGMLCGVGFYTCASSGDVYVGEFLNDVPHGFGVKISAATGLMIRGQWSGGFLCEYRGNDYTAGAKQINIDQDMHLKYSQDTLETHVCLLQAELRRVFEQWEVIHRHILSSRFAWLIPYSKARNGSTSPTFSSSTFLETELSVQFPRPDDATISQRDCNNSSSSNQPPGTISSIRCSNGSSATYRGEHYHTMQCATTNGISNDICKFGGGMLTVATRTSEETVVVGVGCCERPTTTTVLHGRGVLTCENGDELSGSFFHNQCHGYGVIRRANGEVMCGDWQGGVLVAMCCVQSRFQLLEAHETSLRSFWITLWDLASTVLQLNLPLHLIRLNDTLQKLTLTILRHQHSLTTDTTLLSNAECAQFLPECQRLQLALAPLVGRLPRWDSISAWIVGLCEHKPSVLVTLPKVDTDELKSVMESVRVELMEMAVGIPTIEVMNVSTKVVSVLCRRRMRTLNRSETMSIRGRAANERRRQRGEELGAGQY